MLIFIFKKKWKNEFWGGMLKSFSIFSKNENWNWLKFYLFQNIHTVSSVLCTIKGRSDVTRNTAAISSQNDSLTMLNKKKVFQQWKDLNERMKFIILAILERTHPKCCALPQGIALNVHVKSHTKWILPYGQHWH